MSVVMQRGFSMIEVLIAIFVLVIGVIGAAGLQMAALRSTQQAAFQTVALQLASELADKMRANDQAMRVMKDGKAANPFIGIDYAAKDTPTSPNVFCYGDMANCNAADLAAFDIYEWQSRLRAVLPSARAVVCRDSTPWSDGTDNYRWDCDSADAANAAVVIKIGWQSKNPDGSLIRDSATEKTFAPGLALAVAPYIK
jgi:type IV pilus assembly protein PilV